MDPVSVHNAGRQQQDEYRSPRQDGKSYPGKDHNCPRVGRVADVPVRTFPDNGLPFLDTYERREEPAEYRDRPLPEKDPQDHERNSGVKYPVGQHSNSRQGKSKSKVDYRDETDQHKQP